MTARRNTIEGALKDWFTTELQSTYGRGYCTRDLAVDPDKIAAEKTPALLLWSRMSAFVEDEDYEESDNDWPFKAVNIDVLGLVKLFGSGSSAGTIQEQLAELEELCESVLEVTSLSGIPVTVLPNGDCDYGPTPDKLTEGIISFPIRVRYPRF